MTGDGLELPIFELPVVILPGELLPLHIFEERYKRMIGHCLDNAEPFGIVFRDEGGNAHRIGCMARVTEVVERFDDGRMNVVVAGEQPFKVLERFEAANFPAGEVEPIDASDDPADEDAEAASVAREAFAELVKRVVGRAPGCWTSSEAENSYGIAARVELPAETKQALLELRSEPDRMRMLGDALRRPGRRPRALARDRRAREDERQGRRRELQPTAFAPDGGQSGRFVSAQTTAIAPPRRGSPPPRNSPGLGVSGHGVDAAEEQVPLRPAGDGVPPRLEPRQGLGIDPGLGMDRARLEVDARRLDRLGGLHPVGDQPDDRLQHRGADPVRAAAAEPQPRARPRGAARSATSSRAPAARRAGCGSRAG